jgi:hypothetical protein
MWSYVKGKKTGVMLTTCAWHYMHMRNEGHSSGACRSRKLKPSITINENEKGIQLLCNHPHQHKLIN